ncbi:MAG: ABC transporter permease [Anaerolineae bacterium]|nr:ABC transporter permease [Anaerolineae bacterium]
MAMAEGKQDLQSSGIAKLDVHLKGESLWASAWKRMLHNRLAIMGLVIILIAILVAVFADTIALKPYFETDLRNGDSAPYWVTQVFTSMVPVEDGGYIKINNDYPLGADNLGRDIFSRIVYGTRISLLVAFAGPVFALGVGLIVGLASGYFGGALDNVLMRVVDIMYAFPTLLFIILLMTFFRFSTATPEPGSFTFTLGQLDKSTGGMLFIFIGIGFTSWMQMARLVRGQVLSAREEEYVVSARAMGANTPRIMWRHILPNILGPLIVAETLTIPQYISYEAFLSFIGLGVQVPTPSWGSMISDGSRAISSYPNQAIFPALALFFVMFAFNFLGDGLRDALDPRMRGVG